MIQPSLTGPTAGRGRLVHALFATQHCVLGYYQAVPYVTVRYKQLSQFGGGRGMHLTASEDRTLSG
jgi:hypothetical protein